MVVESKLREEIGFENEIRHLDKNGFKIAWRHILENGLETYLKNSFETYGKSTFSIGQKAFSRSRSPLLEDFYVEQGH